VRRKGDMTAKQKIEQLTNAWYGFALVTGLLTLAQNGIGFFSLLTAAGSTLFSFFLTWFLGRRLLARSGFWRTILVVFSGLGILFGTLGAARLAWGFVGTWSLSMLLGSVCAVVLVSMYVRSWRTLRDPGVVAYFG
jgi:hypothetical protein